MPKYTECSKSSSKRKAVAIKRPILRKNFSSKQLNITSQGAWKRTKHKISKRKIKIKITAEINGIETRKIVENINETRVIFCVKKKLINLELN